MTNYLLVNDVIKYIANNKYVRIVWIENNNKYCYIITLFIKKIEIEYVEIDNILNDLKCGNSELIENMECVHVNEKLSDKQNELLVLACKIAEDIFNSKNEPECYRASKRRTILLEVAQRHGISEKTVYKYMRKYLQGGKVKYALVSDLGKCGAQGRKRSSDGKKRGRPSYISIATGKTMGINVSEEIEKICNISLSRYYRNSKQRSLAKAYRMMLKDFFSYEAKENGQLINKIKDTNEIPSLNQFKYWFYKQEELERNLISRIGQKKFDLNYKTLKSDSTYETMGPGFRYQIDATIADVFLISRIDRKSVIGRPVVYMIIDVFSRMITGINVSLEGPSWNEGATALYNCMEDKVEFCKKYNIEINAEDWYVKGIPQVLMADRGEFVGPIAEKLVENLKISIENAPSYMGCAKGIVEQYFHVINTEIKHWLPGEVKKAFRERGERDYRYDAKLDINQFTKIIILAVLKRNKTFMPKYPLTKEMIADEVNPIPIEIWNWGIKNRTGNLRSLPQNILRINLLKSGKASVVRRGVKFKNVFYSCLLAEQQKWFLNAQIKGVRYVDIRYDDRDMSKIYIIMPKNEFVIAEIIEENTSNIIFNEKTIQEIEDYQYNLTVKESELKNDMNNINLNMDLEIEKIIKESEKLNNGGKNNLKNIRDNRRIENESYRKKQALNNEIISDVKEEDNNIINDKEYDSKSNLLSKLRKIKERKENGR